MSILEHFSELGTSRHLAFPSHCPGLRAVRVPAVGSCQLGNISSNSRGSSVGRGRARAARAPPLLWAHRAGVTLQGMAGSWGLHTQQGIGWPRAPMGSNSNPAAAVGSVPSKRGILWCIFTCF